MHCCRGLDRLTCTCNTEVPDNTLHVHSLPMAARSAGIALRGVTLLTRGAQRAPACRPSLQSRHRCVQFQRIAAALAVVGSPFVSSAAAQGTCRALSTSVQCMAAPAMEAPSQASAADNPLLQVLT